MPNEQVALSRRYKPILEMKDSKMENKQLALSKGHLPDPDMKGKYHGD
jgi:hypothetical protein